MAPVIPLRPMADGMLIDFFLNTETGLGGKRLQRVERAHVDLLTCFTVHLNDVAPEVSGSLEASNRMERPDAAAAAVPPKDILAFLPFFLDEPRWHGDELQDRVVRADLAWKLAQWVGWRLDERGSEPYEAVRMAVWRSRTAVRRMKAEAAHERLEERAKDSPALRQALRDIEAIVARSGASRGAAAPALVEKSAGSA